MWKIDKNPVENLGNLKNLKTPSNLTQITPIGNDEKATLWNDHLHTKGFQLLKHIITLLNQLSGQNVEEALRCTKSFNFTLKNDSKRFLQLCWTCICHLCMHQIHIGDQCSRSIWPSNAPSSQWKCLTSRANGNCSFPHARQWTNSNMFIVIVNNPFVHFIG